MRQIHLTNQHVIDGLASFRFETETYHKKFCEAKVVYQKDFYEI